MENTTKELLERKAEEFLEANKVEDLILGIDEKGEFIGAIDMMVAFVENQNRELLEWSKKNHYLSITEDRKEQLLKNYYESES